MEATVFNAEKVHSTWSKKGVLFENGLFIVTFAWMNKPSYFATVFHPDNIPTEIWWGKGVLGAFEDYQVFKPIDESKSISNDEHLKDYVQLIIGDKEFNKIGTGQHIKWAAPIKDCLDYLGIK